MTDGLKDAHRAAIIAEVAANDRVERAVLFGSRATGTNTVSSDVDIALFGDRLTLTDQARLASALDEISMAQSVDLLLYDLGNESDAAGTYPASRRRVVRTTDSRRSVRYLARLRLSWRLDIEKTWSGLHQDRQRSDAARRQRGLCAERTVRFDPEPERTQ